MAQDGDDAGLGQADKARVRCCRQRGEKEAAARAAARSRRVIGSCVRRSGDQGRLDETSAPIRKLPVMLSMQCAG